MSHRTATSDVWDLLSSGGAVLTRSLTVDGNSHIAMAKYDPLADPAGALTIAGLLAQKAADLQPTVAVAWEDLEDAFLAFVVGAELRVPATRAFEMEGLITAARQLPAGSRGVAVTDAIRNPAALEALHALFRQGGGVLAGVVSVVDLGAPTGDALALSLVSAADGPIDAGDV